MLLVLSFPGASRFCFGHGSGGDNASCVDHACRDVHILVRPLISRDVAVASGGALEVDG